MKLSLMLCGLCLVTILACQKDKFTTTPQVSLKSITPNSVVIGDIIRVKGTFTDKEGDVDSAYIIYKWYNGANIVKNDTFRYYLPALGVPAATKDGDILVEFSYGRFQTGYVQLSSVSKDTTSTFGIMLVDHQKNKSEYKESKQIRLLKP